MAKTGGFVRRSNSGRLLFQNCRDSVDEFLRVYQKLRQTVRLLQVQFPSEILIALVYHDEELVDVPVKDALAVLIYWQRKPTTDFLRFLRTSLVSFKAG